MRIVLISDWFAEKMGYAENCLPKAMAALGHDVHLITSDVQPYFHLPLYKETYEPFLGKGIVPCGTKPFEGYTLHRLPHGKTSKFFWIKGLTKQLRTLRPDVVQTFDAFVPSTLACVRASRRVGFRLFLETHLHASVLPPRIANRRLAWWFYRRTVGRWINQRTELCYPISEDTADIVIRLIGLDPQKMRVCSLGVDTALFHPPTDPVVRDERRRKLGFAASDVVCVYTGRFAEDKGPLVLAQAIDRLTAAGEPYRGLFVGSGTQSQVAAIQECRGCVIQPFVLPGELPPFYWAADIGVWPRQESTSQLDAAACGLPLILSDRVHVRERAEGNGVFYNENSVSSLCDAIRSLASPDLRRKLGECGAGKMEQSFSWNRIARERIKDYESVLGGANHALDNS